VILREDAPGVRRLVAYVIGDGGVDPGLLQAHCSQLLPEHMVPADVVVLDKFPITINGKVDRRALPAPRSDEAPSLRDADYHDDLEYMVAQAFARTLGCAQVPLQASFFDLGGDSLSAMTMMAQLESALSVKLSLSELFDAPSVVAFSERIRSGSTNGTARVMQLKGGSGVPVWLLAGVMHYVHLARAMKGDNPVYVVLLPLEEAMIRHGTPLPTFDVLAERYMEVVRRHTPHGPYVIGGFSFGGAVAYEVCRRLREQGERVDQLLLFDTVLPGALSHGGARSGPWARLANVRRTLMARGWRGVIDKVRHRMAGATSERALPQEERERRRMEAARMAEFARVLRDFEQGMQPYEGAVVLYRAKGEDARRIVTRGHGFAPGVKGPWAQFEVNGDHTGMMTPGHVEAIAQDLDARLRVHASQQATTDFQGATV
jgi:thioesterase domain-containing protein/acyl carrier protein